MSTVEPTSPVDPAADAADGSPAPAAGLRANLRGVGAWLLLAGGALALDGIVGAGVAVLVGAILLARLPHRLIGGLGVVALIAAPIAVLVDGVPSVSEVSPAFVSRSLLPYHLTFAGLLLVSVWAVLDLVPHLVRGRSIPPTPDPADDAPLLGWPLSIAVLAVVAVAAVWASMAVLQA